MADSYAPFKLLEINVLSAQDLPPVSKMLRTFAVAWIHPDQKLSTKIDHQGHANPSWNYKLVFRVDDKFLRNETAAITFEIYNVAWLRDIPIGTAYLFINHISPPLIQNIPVMRPVAIHIRRPTGHLQGILHVGVSLIDNNISSSPLMSELSAATIENIDMVQDDPKNVQIQHIIEDTEYKVHQQKIDQLKIEMGDSILQRQPSTRRNVIMPCDDDSSSVQEGNESKVMIKMKSFASTNLSLVSAMHPLPSEVAFNLKKGFYTVEGDDDYGSSIFENWSEPSDVNAGGCLRSKSGTWKMEDQIPLTLDNDIQNIIKELQEDHHKVAKVHEGGHKSARPKRRRNSTGGGLFSCFGNGFEFTFAYGSKTLKEDRQKTHHHEKLPDEKISRFYI